MRFASSAGAVVRGTRAASGTRVCTGRDEDVELDG